MASSSNIDQGSPPPHYPYPSHVNDLGNLVSTKLTSADDYLLWKEQMLCALDSHDMLGFVDGTFKEPKEYDGSKTTTDLVAFKDNHRRWKRSDNLVKAWIYASISERRMRCAFHSKTAEELWRELYCQCNKEHTKEAMSSQFSSAHLKYVQAQHRLYKAIVLRDWEMALEIFNQGEVNPCDRLLDTGLCALQVAVSIQRNTPFLRNLLDYMGDKVSLPILAWVVYYAICCGNKIVVEMMVNKNPHVLFYDEDYGSHFPLVKAATLRQRPILDYLFEVYKQYIYLTSMYNYNNPFEGTSVCRLLETMIESEYFDVAFDLLKHYYHELATVDDDENPWGIADCLAKNPDAFRSAKHYNFCQKFVYSYLPVKNCTFDEIENRETCRDNLVIQKSYLYPVMEKIVVKFWEFALHVPYVKDLHDDKVKHNQVFTLLNFCLEKNGKLPVAKEGLEDMLILAVKNDISEVVEQIARRFPLSIRNTLDARDSLYEVSIKNRCENVYKFLVNKEETYYKDLHYRFDASNLLHLAGELAPADKLDMVSGAALQMQRELRWFKEVSKLVTPTMRTTHNKEGETPLMVFKREHKDLRQKGEDWMKHTANSYTITTGLIITIVFAAIITVPGGNNQDTGRAIYAKKLGYKIFLFSVAFALFSSATSLLNFLSILMARYAEEDFLTKLPKRLIRGLISLFMAVTTMLIAFSAAIFIMFGYEEMWVLYLTVAMALMPIITFGTMQLPLLVDLISSTYGHGNFGKRRRAQ